MATIWNIQSAVGDLAIGVPPTLVFTPLGASLLALPDNNDTSGIWWTREEVPGERGYFWLHCAEDALVIGINPQGGIGPGSQLQLQKQDYRVSQWWTAVAVPSAPGRFWLMSAVRDLVIEIDDADGIGPGSQLQVAQRHIRAEQWWNWATVPLVPPPVSGLRSSNNYFLVAGYDQATGFLPLNEVVVSIQITEDLIGSTQFSFQLNCWSPNPTMQEQRIDGPLYDVWQQYGLSGGPSLGDEVDSFAENWPLSGPNLFNLELPGFYRVKDNGRKMLAGTYTTIQLTQLDVLTGPISGSRVVVSDATKAAVQKIKIIGSPLANGGKATANDLAPIAAMQMNIVGWANYADAVFTSGAGTIRYFSSTPMTVVPSPPADISGPGSTGETSNITYGELPNGKSNIFLQTFGYSN